MKSYRSIAEKVFELKSRIADAK